MTLADLEREYLRIRLDVAEAAIARDQAQARLDAALAAVRVVVERAAVLRAAESAATAGQQQQLPQQP